MSEFDPAVEFVLRHEGGLTESPSDAGGITNFGISLRFLRELRDERLRRYGIFKPIEEDTVRALTRDQAKFIYRGEFWEEAPFCQIEVQSLCNYIFDMSVNMGLHQAIKLLQRAIWAITWERGKVVDDGILGPRTLGYVNKFGGILISQLMGIRGEYYRCLVAKNPKQDIYLNGWLNRCYNVK